MFKSRNDKEALSSAMDEYIRDHAPVSCDDLVRAMEEQGFHCYPNMARKYLKDKGLTVKSIEGRWFWGMWDDEDVDEDDERPVPEPIKRTEDENEQLQSENRQLIVALLKTSQLKKSIKSMQEKLLVELADLIHAIYGEQRGYLAFLAQILDAQCLQLFGIGGTHTFDLAQ